MKILKRGDHVSCERFAGVAAWYVGQCSSICDTCVEGTVYWDDVDEDGEPYEVEEYCPVCHPDCAVIILVGDDQRHHVDPDTLTAIDEDDFCGGCGQIGCAHG